MPKRAHHAEESCLEGLPRIKIEHKLKPLGWPVLGRFLDWKLWINMNRSDGLTGNSTQQAIRQDNMLMSVAARHWYFSVADDWSKMIDEKLLVNSKLIPVRIRKYMECQMERLSDRVAKHTEVLAEKAGDNS